MGRCVAMMPGSLQGTSWEWEDLGIVDHQFSVVASLCVCRAPEGKGHCAEGEAETTERQSGRRLTARVAESAAQLGEHVRLEWSEKVCVSLLECLHTHSLCPPFLVRRGSKRVKELWWLGLPPGVRGQVWKRAIGNDLNISSGEWKIQTERWTLRGRLVGTIFIVSFL